ncbi:CerR family C-terminal domain-containing protein [Sphingomonas sp. AR_OL41]|uniref:CerR family C-terminal domain-containing protein n=1 Tax=Sphingomonas sp. AR_OL41 TaxID=3042729 RepID=UPI00248051E9|nr:CerR family C-terminal domain-containing protein [Sphingomonas sp. AR_OL41]MDH7976028.1 CerR family C-terminal domain-containing protein [Sphingomonas sp. AR_OL41]
MSPSTDSRLLDVAVDHFGRLGLDGASTRAIARDADTLMSSITYHFGGKEGLYLAAADHIAQHMHGKIAPLLEHAIGLCGDEGDTAAARASLHAMIAGMVQIMLRDETAAISRFIVREQADPTEAFTRIYSGVMGQMLERLAALVARVSGGRLTDAEARIRAIALVGQVLVFRVARATVMTGMGWTHIGADDAALIGRTIAANLDAVLDQLQAGDPA